MRRILKWALGIMVLNTVVWAAGQAITRSKSSQDLTTDELDVYTFWMGREVVSRATSLRRVRARVLMGGLSIDLREASLADEAVTVDVSTLMGGTAVLVRKDWNVEVVEQTRNATVEVDLDEIVTTEDDRPRVTVLLRTTNGGAYVGYQLPKDRDSGTAS